MVSNYQILLPIVSHCLCFIFFWFKTYWSCIYVDIFSGKAEKASERGALNFIQNVNSAFVSFQVVSQLCLFQFLKVRFTCELQCLRGVQ